MVPTRHFTNVIDRSNQTSFPWQRHIPVQFQDDTMRVFCFTILLSLLASEVTNETDVDLLPSVQSTSPPPKTIQSNTTDNNTTQTPLPSIDVLTTLSNRTDNSTLLKVQAGLRLIVEGHRMLEEALGTHLPSNFCTPLPDNTTCTCSELTTPGSDEMEDLCRGFDRSIESQQVRFSYRMRKTREWSNKIRMVWAVLAALSIGATLGICFDVKGVKTKLLALRDRCFTKEEEEKAVVKQRSSVDAGIQSNKSNI
ncbi:hypothetical protein CAPTEDRAFT_197831 [Capitella teleta]|uniref:Uncharacterized protein n=1 Tax=Capitella teleta TaxID=283909 RepID=R7T6Q5_CAPTE|nr:hypothetical protein CAPTEDRAFT_197831 [Capitella teleta]|eukprot:ELT87055.1 hypothetical protein CAPTEDRAFT_197831 [Capitella teleta]